MGVYPGSGTPCFGAGIDLLNFLPMRAGFTVSFRSLLPMAGAHPEYCRQALHTEGSSLVRRDSLRRNPKMNLASFPDFFPIM
jgi:hypothetical protein